MSSPSPESIEFTKLFLFGTVAAVDYLSPEIIRPENATTPKDYDVNIYMAGPGRFATVDKFLVTQLFFSSADKG